MVSSWSFRVPFRIFVNPRCCVPCWRIEKLQWRRITCSPTGAEILAEELVKKGSGLEKNISLKTHACCLFDDFFTQRLSKTAWALFTWGPSYVRFRDRDVFGTASKGSPFSLAWLQVSWWGTWCAGCWQWGWWRGPPGIELSAQDRDDKVFYT